MPNGGSDCCGTCCFNSTHPGQSGYFRNPDEGETRCVIRDLTIDVPFWTYCANHPHHNLERVELPVGPVYHGSGGWPYRREVIAESPDRPEIRQELLRLVAAIQERPRREYPTSPTFDEAVIDQLMRFREARAVAELRRIAQLDPLAAPEGENPFDQNRVMTVARALEALGVLAGDAALPELARGLEYGLTRPAEPPADEHARTALATVRYFSVRGLEHCASEPARALLRRAADDPDPEIAALAKGFLESGPSGA
jgi:hypothetical protein